MRRWDALDATPIPGTEIASYPAISPDGREVAFSAVDWSVIRVVPLAGGNGVVYSQPGPDGLDIIRRLDVETGVVTDVTDTGHLVFQGADGVLLAAPFDVRASALTGPAVPVVDEVAMSAGNQPGFFAVSRSEEIV